MNQLSKSAIRYASVYGWYIFPLKPNDKTPATKNGLKDATNDDAQIEAWWTQNPQFNIGLNCGASGLVALDFDVSKATFTGGALLAQLMSDYPTVTSETGSGGYHLLYGQPDGVKLGNGRGNLPSGVDVRGHGGYIVLPPSVHPNGKFYQWAKGKGIGDIEIAPLPAFVLEMIQTKPTVATVAPATIHANGNHSRYAEAALNGEVNKLLRTGEGGRNQQLNKSSFALGQLVSAGVLDESTVTNHLQAAAQAVGLDNRETDKTLKSGLVAGMAKPRQIPERNIDSGDNGEDGDNEKQSGRNRPKQADILFNLVHERAQLFTAQDGEKFARVPIDDHFECYALTSKAFREYCDGLFFVNHKTIPGADAKKDAIGLLSFYARTNKRTVFYRIGTHNSCIYIDLGTEDWSAIEIDTTGWQIVKTYPVLFRRSGATKPLPLPVAYDDLMLLCKHINLNSSDWPLLSAWLVASAMPDVPTPILTFPNEAGTGKTTNTNRLKSLLDPGMGRTLPGEARDVMVTAENNWHVAFDNVSSISAEIADVLCQVVTGGEYAKRANYADKDEAVMQVQRPVIINGIGNITSDRPDLMQRSLMIRPPIIPKERRVAEKISDAKFEIDRPRIMGALFGEISKMLRVLPSVQLTELPRMADFARIGYALHGQKFTDAYNANIENAISNAADSSPLVDFVQKLAKQGKWEGTATRLLDTLNAMEGADKHQKSKDWPKSNRVIKNAMQRVAPLLRGVGVQVTQTDNKLGSWFVIEQSTQGERVG